MSDTAIVICIAIIVANIFIAIYIVRLLRIERKRRDIISESWRREQAKKEEEGKQ